MQKHIENFGEQLRHAIEIGEEAKLSGGKKKFDNVVIAGMGGSGMGGRVVSELVLSEAKIPIAVISDYVLPQYVSAKSLIIISSYSGNTEEVLSALKDAEKRKAKIVCIASGGKLAKLAEKKKFDLILIPAGMPPRACVGYSLVEIFYILHHFGIVSGKFKKDIRAAIKLLEKERQSIKKEALGLAKFIFGKFPVIYAPVGQEGVAIRFRQQLNENAKMLTSHHVIPEMNHNELQGWRDKNKNLVVIFFRNDSDHPQVQKRINVCKEIIAKYTPHIKEIKSKGNSLIEKTMYHIHVGDFISAFLADLRGTDPEEVGVIEYLKSRLK